ncbi:TspO/MBR family protein [Parasphingorhabdus sp. DH2-15]|uniref:TspO/MBR family protein n=1 Tax=Parasphingorhabdus sp. DH2-15 TaxID=3444112 RepID=UPI003F684E3C
MSELASRSQLRLSFLRWAMLTVPLTVLLGFMSSRIAEPAGQNAWFQSLVKPAAQPEGWVFGAAWFILYILIALALAIVLNARNARLRWIGVSLWCAQFLLNLIWSPLFFGAHQIGYAFYLLLMIFLLSFATVLVFGRIRPLAAWLMVPYLAWLCFAAILNKQIDDLNPGAATKIVPRSYELPSTTTGGALPPAQ